jgi:hypothetical protein
VAANSVRPQSPSRVTVTPRVARAANAACIFADKPPPADAIQNSHLSRSDEV